ncbi:MAG: chromosome segregation SMC family protein [Candidatus Anstonellales archaeon]
MRLKSLRFKNFKSFKNAEIIFNSNINVIMGPNGSGKSNICDALKFILGDRSLTSLRAKSSKDLIYTGAQEARVEAIFSDANEEIILERVIKDDKNVYILNSKRMTYEEYINELAKRNLGNSHRFFIMQGQVDRLIGLGKKERLQLLYDGAGVNQFETRKEEIKEEIKIIDERIGQISLLIGEKLKFLEELKLESDRADKYYQIKNRIELLKNSISYREYISRKRALDNLKTKIDEISKSKTELLSKLEEIKNKIQIIEQEREKITAELTSNQTSRAFLELTDQQERLEKKRNELLDYQRILFERNKLYQGMLNRRQELLSTIESLKAKIRDEDTGDIENYIRELNSINSELVLIEGELTNLSVKYREFGELIRSVGDLKRLKEELERVNKEIVDMYRKDNELSKELKSIDDNIKTLERERDQYQFQSSISSLESFIRDLRENMPGVYDLVINLISFDPRLRNAIDAFGSRLLNIVVEDIDVAKRISETIKSSNIKLGRISIIPLQQLNVTNYRNVNIGLGLLKSHIEIDRKFDRVLDYVFGDVILMSNFDDAKRYVGKYRMVTLDGEFFDISGVVSVGSQGISVSAARVYAEIVRKIDELKLTRDRIVAQREEIMNRISELREMKASLDSKIQLLSKSISEKELEEMGNRIESLNSRKIELMKRKEELDNILSKYQERVKYIQEMAAIKKELEIKVDELQRLEAGLLEVDQEIRDLNIKIRQMSDEVRIAELSVAQKRRQYLEMDSKIKEKMNASKIKEDELKRLGLEQQKISDELAQIEKLYYRYEKEISNLEIELRSINYREDMEVIEGSLDEMKEELLRLESEMASMGNINFKAKEMYELLNRDIGELDAKINKLREEKEELIRMLGELEAKKQSYFRDFINRVNARFGELTNSIPGLGIGNIEIVDDDVIISLSRNGRTVRLESLSGGERSLLGLLLIFAMNMENPLPIAVFDEVDAALDMMNKERLKEFIKAHAQNTQFIIVTHSQDLAKVGENIIGVSRGKDGSRLAQITQS